MTDAEFIIGRIDDLSVQVVRVYDCVKGNGKEGLEARLIRLEEQICGYSQSHTRIAEIIVEFDPRLTRIESALERITDQLREHTAGPGGSHEKAAGRQERAREIWLTTFGRIIAGIAGGLVVLIAGRYL